MRIYNCFPQGKTKVLTMSYDDGVKEADKRLVDIFNKHGIKGTFNLNSGFFGKDVYLDAEEVGALYAGHEVATHTVHHHTIARCPMSLVADEILEDRKALEKLMGYPVRGHAYPNGSYNKEIEALFQSVGIAYGRVTETTGSFGLPEDPMEWRPTCHHRNNLMELARQFVEIKGAHRWNCMYVWGHSYEFDRNNNWELIEEFCEFMGGREDIWYATNIEIIDYLKVCRDLQFAADCSFVYNPSAASAWIYVADVLFTPGRVVEVKGGSQVQLV